MDIKKLKDYFYKYWKLFLVLMAVIGIVGSVSAKYVSTFTNNGNITSKLFYFNSNVLEEGGTYIEVNKSCTEFPFTLTNYLDELNFSEDNITFNISVEGDYDSNALPKLTLTNGSLPGQKNSSVQILIQNLKPGKTYTIKAVGNAGYVKTLQATIKVKDDDAVLYKYLDTSNPAYVDLHVNSKYLKGDLNVKFIADGLMPDDTDPILHELDINNFDSLNNIYKKIEFIDTVNFSSVDEASYKYRFFIDDATNIDINNFIVMIGSHTAIEYEY